MSGARAEVVGDRVHVTLPNGYQVNVTLDEARELSADPAAAARFLATWSVPGATR